jgi:predicted dehydrogenase
MLKIGVFGAGHLGKIHLRLLEASDRYELVGFYDSNKVLGAQLEKEKGYSYFDSAALLLEKVDVIDIVTPTMSHAELATQALQAGKHLFIEKPITSTVAEADTLCALAIDHQCIGQIGHVERFNPAFKAARPHIVAPMFIETHRLAEFNPRGTDVPVVLDLMIHDLDIILSVVQSPVKQVHASGVSVISETPDIANARVEFENGCVANLTASRISLKNMRKTRFFQKDAYISVDFLAKNVEIVKMKDPITSPDEFALILENAEGQKKQIYFENPTVESNNAIQEELESLADSIENKQPSKVSLEDGTQALKLAHQIITAYA